MCVIILHVHQHVKKEITLTVEAGGSYGDDLASQAEVNPSDQLRHYSPEISPLGKKFPILLLTRAVPLIFILLSFYKIATFM